MEVTCVAAFHSQRVTRGQPGSLVGSLPPTDASHRLLPPAPIQSPSHQIHIPINSRLNSLIKSPSHRPPSPPSSTQFLEPAPYRPTIPLKLTGWMVPAFAIDLKRNILTGSPTHSTHSTHPTHPTHSDTHRPPAAIGDSSSVRRLTMRVTTVGSTLHPPPIICIFVIWFTRGTSIRAPNTSNRSQKCKWGGGGNFRFLAASFDIFTARRRTWRRWTWTHTHTRARAGVHWNVDVAFAA